MATAHRPGGLYKSADGSFHDANGDPVPEAFALLGIEAPASEGPGPAPVPEVGPEAEATPGAEFDVAGGSEAETPSEEPDEEVEGDLPEEGAGDEEDEATEEGGGEPEGPQFTEEDLDGLGANELAEIASELDLVVVRDDGRDDIAPTRQDYIRALTE